MARTATWTPTLVDLHCHLGAYPQVDEVILDAHANDVGIVVATSRPSEHRGLKAFVGGAEGVEVGIGLHPECAGSVYEETELEILAEMATSTTWVSEIGLDGAIASTTSPSFGSVPTMLAQMSMLERVLELTSTDQCYSVHSRGAEQAVIDMLLDAGRSRVVLHSFAGPLDVAARAADAGYLFSVHPQMLRTELGRKLVRWIPLELILLETDGPYFSWDGRRIAPSDLREIAVAVARLKAVETREFTEALRGNMQRLVPSMSGT